VTVDQNATPTGPGASRGGAGVSDVERITTTILTAVERQLTKYFTAMSHQAEAARMAAEQRANELRQELAAKFPALEAAVEAQRVANEHYQQALQGALEERLAEFANHQHWRLNDLEEKIQLAAGTASGSRELDPETILEIRQTVRDDMERSFAGIHARLDDINNVNKRHDEQASAIVQHVNDTTAALTMRMDEGDQRLGHAIEERLNQFAGDLAVSFEGVAEQVNEHASTLLQKLESSESRATDRMLELEQRIKDEQGQKIANVEATVGRIGSGFDDAMIAVSQRVLELENRLLELEDRFNELNERLGKVDENALEEVKAEMSRAVGEAMLVRIELDRVVANVDEKMDKQTIRMSEIEGLLSDQMDVSTAVQLERLDELERQMEMLDPSQFVRIGQAGQAGQAGGSTAPLDGTPTTGSTPLIPTSDPSMTTDAARAGAPSLSLNPRLPGADTGQDSLETQPDLTSH
jgi:tetrahydromethanopterin S-methyltransferase subunit G